MKIEMTTEEFKELFGQLSHEEFVQIAKEKINKNKKRGRPKKT